MNLCAVCNAPSTKRCTACIGAYYCSKEHQKQDWKNHKGTCLPYQIKEDASLGRHLVAARQLAAGKLVFKENLSFFGTGTVSSMEQSCIPNCYKVNNLGEITVRAAQPIAPGEHLSLCHINPLIGTRHRLQSLNRFNSTCNCIRCLDPTELGTHFSSLKCRKTGCNGLLVPPDSHLFSDVPWKCQICSGELSASNVKKLILSVRAAFSPADNPNFAECQNLINRFERYLHENHYLLTDIRLYTTRIPIGSFTEDDWKVQLKYCLQLDQLLSKIAHASYKIRCYIMFRLSTCLIEVNGENAAEEVKQVVDKALPLLEHDPEVPDIDLALYQLGMLRGFPMPAAGH